MKLVMSAVVAMMVSFAALASGIVTNVSIRQVRPWQGMVEVNYELTEDRSSDPGLSTTVTFMDQQNDKVYDAKTFTHPFTYTKGVKRMVWNAAKDNVAFKSSNVICKVEVKRELYCVIDLSGGTNATSYPVTTLSSVPEGGWTDEYKTSKLVLRYIEPGTFMMGSPTNEIGRNNVFDIAFEESLHKVTLTKGYYIGIFEVTQRQWELVMGTRPSYFTNELYYAARPVEAVTYSMARGDDGYSPYYWTPDPNSFVGKIRSKTKYDFDLPTEAQWEYACRAGTTTAFNNGKNIESMECELWASTNLAEVARYRFNGGSLSVSSYATNYLPDRNSATNGTSKVGQYQPNAYGLYDMHGNVYEWCVDAWRGDVIIDEIDPCHINYGPWVLRGGGWSSSPKYCRAAFRTGSYGAMSFEDGGESTDLGFRVNCRVE